MKRSLFLKPFVYNEDVRIHEKEDDQRYSIIVEAFEEKSYASKETSCETRLENASVEDALYFILDKFKGPLELKKVVINKIENKVKYNEIQIPKGGFFEALAFLDERYSFFKRSAKMFLENSVFYLLHNEIDHTYTEEKDHYNNLSVVFASGLDYKEDLKEEVDPDIVLNREPYNIDNNLNYSERDIGKKIKFFQQNFLKTDIENKVEDEENTVEDSSKTKDINAIDTFVSTGFVHSTYAKDHYMAAVKSGIVLNCRFKNCDLNKHCTNTIYDIEFKDTKHTSYNGQWHLVHGEFVCENDEEGKFAPFYYCVLQKMEK